LGDFVNPSQEDLGFTFGAGRGNLTTDLSDDHPFSFVYNNSLATTDGLLVQPGVNGAAIAPLPLSSGDYVECTTCHDVHDNTLPPFLHVQSLNGDICLTCHDATALGFTNSTHGTSTETGAGGTPWSDRRSEWAGANVAENSCMNCHKPHNAPTPIRLLKGAEEATCYSCHNSSTTNISDIQTDAAKAHSHPIDAISGEHDIERLENTAPSTIHAECQDCHDPHTVETPLNPMVTLDSAGNAVAPGHTGEANSRIQGVLGTEDGLNFSTIVDGDPQYKLCYKCHGLSGKGPCPGSGNADERCSAVNDSILTGGNTMDKRVDRVYNIREKFIGSYQAPPEGNDTGTPGYSFHPIEENNPANDSVIASLKTGLDASTTIIYCTDCHNSDVSAAGDVTVPVLRDPTAV
jgi:predicted CXXCH cytochrome family protein